MPIIHYFVVVSFALIGLLFGIDYLAPSEKPVQAAQPSSLGSIHYWRAAQQRHDRSPEAAIDLTDMASSAPTADRLLWEQQLRLIPEGGQPEPGVMNARAEFPKETIEVRTSDAVKAAALDKPVTEAAPPVKKRVSKAPHPRLAQRDFIERDGWGRPVARETYRQSSSRYAQPSWGGPFSFFN